MEWIIIFVESLTSLTKSTLGFIQLVSDSPEFYTSKKSTQIKFIRPKWNIYVVPILCQKN